MNRRKQHYSVFKLACVIAVVLLLGVVAFARAHSKPRTTNHTTSSPMQNAPKPSISPQPSAHVDSGLQHIVDTWAAGHSFHSSVVVSELNGSLREASRANVTAMTTASTYKIYVAYAVLHEVEQGKISLGTGTRTGQTVQQALNKMILQSDNNSAEALGFLVGWDAINSLAAQVGATHTNINNYDSSGQPVRGDKLSTAADLALMVTNLQQNQLLNTTNTGLLLSLMKQQVWRERVPAGVPSGVAVADKPGWLANVQNDAAIVYGPKSTYVLVIMTNGSTTQPLADLSKLVYTYLEL